MSPTGAIVSFSLVNIIPHFLWSLILVWIPLRNMKLVLLTLKTYPQIFLVTVFSPFAFGAKSVSCRNCQETASGRIMFSKQGTVVNIIISFTKLVITVSRIISETMKNMQSQEHVENIWSIWNMFVIVTPTSVAFHYPRYL